MFNAVRYQSSHLTVCDIINLSCTVTQLSKSKKNNIVCWLSSRWPGTLASCLHA